MVVIFLFFILVRRFFLILVVLFVMMFLNVGGGVEKGLNEKWIIFIIKVMVLNSMFNELILF